MKKIWYGIVVMLTMFTTIFLIGCAKETKKENPTATKKSSAIENTNSTKWAQNTVFYQIFVRSFADGNNDGIGDFKGIANKVDYLKELGVKAVWLMPIMKTTTYHGYDVVDYYTVNPDYGTMEDFKDMVQVLHENGIRVIIDYVANHTSNQNQWFLEALENKDSIYRDYYFIYDTVPKDVEDIRVNKDSKLYYVGHYDTIMPDLNYGNQKVRDEMKKVAGFWLDLGIDGFRLDGSNNIDADSTITYGWWKEFTSYVKDKNKNAFIVGENWDGDYNVIAPFYSTMDSSFDFPMADAIANMSNGVMRDFVTDFNEAQVAYEKAAGDKDSVNPLRVTSTMINNHDMDRIATRLNDKSNRVAANLLFTLPGTPFIYYGDELGQKGQSPDYYRREPFDWYQKATGVGMVDFKKAVGATVNYLKANDNISYEEEKADSESLFNHYKNLIKMRNANPILFTGTYKTIGMSKGLYAYTVTQKGEEKKILIIHNLRDDDGTFALNVDGTDLYNNSKVTKAAKYTLSAKSMLIMEYTGDAKPLNQKEFTYSNEDDYSVTIKATLPKGTPADDKIYIAGTFNSWNEADPKYVMERTSENTCEITIYSAPKAGIEYKFTRGSWDMREQNAKGLDLIGKDQKQNRTYIFEKDKSTETVTVEKWSDITIK